MPRHASMGDRGFRAMHGTSKKGNLLTGRVALLTICICALLFALGVWLGSTALKLGPFITAALALFLWCRTPSDQCPKCGQRNARGIVEDPQSGRRYYGCNVCGTKFDPFDGPGGAGE